MPGRARHRLFVGQDPHHFSAAHMTVFPDGRKERLHGHTYTVMASVDLLDVSFAHFLDLGLLKDAMRAVCKAWDERFLVAERNPHVRVVRADEVEVELTVCGKRYVVPAEDVVLLPIENVVVEHLAAEVAHRLVAALGTSLQRDVVDAIEVDVREQRQQGATYRWTWPDGP